MLFNVQLSKWKQVATVVRNFPHQWPLHCVALIKVSNVSKVISYLSHIDHIEVGDFSSNISHYLLVGFTELIYYHCFIYGVVGILSLSTLCVQWCTPTSSVWSAIISLCGRPLLMSAQVIAKWGEVLTTKSKGWCHSSPWMASLGENQAPLCLSICR